MDLEQCKDLSLSTYRVSLKTSIKVEKVLLASNSIEQSKNTDIFSFFLVYLQKNALQWEKVTFFSLYNIKNDEKLISDKQQQLLGAPRGRYLSTITKRAEIISCSLVTFNLKTPQT